MSCIYQIAWSYGLRAVDSVLSDRVCSLPSKANVAQDVELKLLIYVCRSLRHLYSLII